MKNNAILKFLSGILLSGAIGLWASWITFYLPAFISPVLIAVFVGILINNTIDLSDLFLPGIRFNVGFLLKFAIILTGARLDFMELIRLGKDGLLLIFVVMATAVSVTFFISKTLEMSGPLVTLIGIGTAICGNSAIIATAPVIHASEEDISYGVTVITLFGTLAVFVYPFIGQILNMSDSAFGLWVATAVHDTSQVLAVSFSYSNLAGESATIIKLTRNVFIVPVLLMLSFKEIRKGKAVAGKKKSGKQEIYGLMKVFPWFIIGFCFMSFIGSLGLFPEPLITYSHKMSHYFILAALAGVGLRTNLRNMQKTGLKPLALGFMAALAAGVGGFLIVTLIY